ncbi:MAG: hypothetical protein Q7T07_00445 [Burkholderiaceae bacterium]|nr:hypothetical protein [Burkholderiaceae bacterium]
MFTLLAGKTSTERFVLKEFIAGARRRLSVNVLVTPERQIVKKLNSMNVAALACLVALVGCAAPVDQLAEKPYCHTDRGMHAFCTKEFAPSLKRDAESKQFASVPDALTVYVVRYWGDGHHPMEISFNGGAPMETVPNTMIRLRVNPGEHQFSFKVDGRSFDRKVSGAAGEVRLLGISGTDWPWGTSHAWSDDSEDQVKRKAIRSRLIKDKSLL